MNNYILSTYYTKQNPKSNKKSDAFRTAFLVLNLDHKSGKTLILRNKGHYLTGI